LGLGENYPFEPLQKGECLISQELGLQMNFTVGEIVLIEL
jgi:hypothetical protein